MESKRSLNSSSRKMRPDIPTIQTFVQMLQASSLRQLENEFHTKDLTKCKRNSKTPMSRRIINLLIGRTARKFLATVTLGLILSALLSTNSYAWNSTALTVVDGYGLTQNHVTIFNLAISDISQVKNADGTPAYPDIVNKY